MTAHAADRAPTAAEPWALEAGEVVAELGVTPAQGLGAAEVRERQAQFGPNRLQARRPRGALTILADQFRSLVVGLLAAAALLAFAFGDHAEGLAIIAVLLVNAAIGFLTEWRATRSMEALRALGHVATRVRRDGSVRVVPAESLVPGDVVLLEPGDRISADLRLVEGSKIAADESALTGESVPVAKSPEPVPADTPMQDRANLLYKGTLLTRGSGEAVVIGTGLATELGRVSELVTAAEAQTTPLEERLDALGRRLVWATLAITFLIAVAGVAAGRELRLAIEVAIALAVAAIPEGLPIVATIALARGMWRMARRNALIVRLSAVETLGATGVILTDKTGTLTENLMTVRRIELPGAALEVSGLGLETEGGFSEDGNAAGDDALARLDELLVAACLCSNATLSTTGEGGTRVTGDPTEAALLVAAAKRGLSAEALHDAMPELREEPFDPATKAMATFNRVDGGLRVSVKGAPEAVLGMCRRVRTADGEPGLEEGDRRAIEQRAEALAREGLRTLMIATREARSVDEDPYADLTALGLVALLDPARSGVAEAIRRCENAGIRVVMVTGDHAATAFTIATEVGIAEPDHRAAQLHDARDWPSGELPLDDADLDAARVFARATPRQKLELIARYQERDQVVAMTGDGVNDAPALKQADIGIAMGRRGTQVAREAAAMVLLDDEFGTIVESVAQGRAIYANLRKFVIYLLSCNVSELLVIGLATAAGAPLPLLPLQILFLNLVTDVFPALALGVGRGPENLMQRPPRPAAEQILEPRHWRLLAVHGLLLSATVLGAMAAALLVLGLGRQEAVTVSFFTLALAQLWHVFNMREARSAMVRNEVTENRYVWGAIALCLVLLAAALLWPPLREVLQLPDPGRDGWLLALGASFLPLIAGQALHRWLRPARGTPTA